MPGNTLSLNGYANMRVVRRRKNLSVPELVQLLADAGHVTTANALHSKESRAKAATEMSVDLAYALAAVLEVTVDELVTAKVCAACSGGPPAGFTCNTCGRSG